MNGLLLDVGFKLMNGDDLVVVLEGEVDLPGLLRHKVRALTEGEVFVSARDLLARKR